MLTIDEANELAVANMSLVYHVAKKYRSISNKFNIDFEDIISAGNVGLVRGSRSYDPELGYKFSTFACLVIMDEILKFIKANTTVVTIPRFSEELRQKIVRLELLDEEPEKIAKKLDCGLDAVKLALKCHQLKTVSTEKVIHHEGSEHTVGSRLPSNDDLSEMYVRDFISTLNEREALILRLRLSEFNQTEIGDILFVSQTLASRLLRKIGKKLEYYQSI